MQNLDEASETLKLVIFQSWRNNNIKEHGMALVINKQLSKFMTSYEATSLRIVNATFKLGSISQTFI